MNPTKPFLQHVKSSNDLVTTYEATRSGFLEMALERNRAGNEFVNQAKILRSIAQTTSNPKQLVDIMEIRPAMITAAGFSDKASKYIHLPDQEQTILEFISEFLIPAGDSYVEELTYRFLLTRGDSIGGSLRNLAGKIAQRKVCQSIASALDLYQKPYSWFSNRKWFESSDRAITPYDIIRGLFWKTNGINRTLIFNLMIPVVGNNVDMSLITCDYRQVAQVVSRSPELIIALGELKGGIDPAGADEHWKTARTALTRIRQGFSNLEKFPDTFFIGAAIEKNMADEIWSQLNQNTLTNAANLTNSEQLSSITTWLLNK